MEKSKQQKAEDLKKSEVEAKNKQAAQNAEEKVKQEEEIEKAAEKNQKEAIVPKTETVAKIDATTDEALKLSEDKQKASGPINKTDIGTAATSEFWTTDDHGRRSHPNDVKFQVKYGSGFKGTQHMEEGSIIVVSQEVAKQFEDLGIGKII